MMINSRNTLLFLFACLTSCTNKENLCAAVTCQQASATIKIQYLDAEGGDLIFSENARYSINDLKIKSSIGYNNMTAGIDSTDKKKRRAVLYSPVSQSLILELGEELPDVLTVKTRFLKEGCCGDLEVEEIKLNTVTVCKPCSLTTPVTIIKNPAQ